MIHLLGAHAVAAAAGPPVAGYFGWWKETGIVSSGGLISQWTDESGNGFHWVQATDTNKPATGRTLGGLDVLDLDGSDNRMSVSFGKAQPISIFIVALTDTVGAGTRSLLGNNTTVCVPMENSTAAFQAYAGGLHQKGTVTVSQGFQATVILNGASSVMSFNGSSEAAADLGTAGLGSGATNLGDYDGSRPWNGIIAELVMYETALGTTDRQSVEAYLKAKWGTP